MNKLLTFFSNSHVDLFNKYFYPSYKQHLSNQFELVIKKIPQICPSADFGSKGFDIAMLEKIKYINEAINLNNDTEILFFADVDVQFFRNIDLSFVKNTDIDIWFQQDYFNNYICAGLFFCRCNSRVYNFFNTVFQILNEKIDNINNTIDDQYVINYLKDINKITKYSLLDSDEYWTVANHTQGQVWNPGMDIVVPHNIVAHHANWTIGVQNKIQLMAIVKERLLCME